MKSISITLLCTILATVSHSSAGQFVLTKDGAARASVILEADADDATCMAARELTNYIFKSSGALVPLHIGAPEPPPSRSAM